jgi:cell division protein FtsL
MSKTYKRRKQKKKPQLKKKGAVPFLKRKRSFAENFLLVMGIFIVLSMILSLVIFQGTAF